MSDTTDAPKYNLLLLLKETKLYIAIYAVFLLLLGAGAVYLFAKEFPTVYNPLELELPATGNAITVSKVHATWREVTEADSVNEGVVIIPEVFIQTSKDSSGTIVGFFQNNNGDTVGDPVSLDLSSTETSEKTSFDDGPKLICKIPLYPTPLTKN